MSGVIGREAQALERLELLQRGERARTLDEDVAAELLVVAIVAHQLSQDRVSDRGEELLLRRRETQRVDMGDEIGRRRKRELGLLEIVGHVRERHRDASRR